VHHHADSDAFQSLDVFFEAHRGATAVLHIADPCVSAVELATPAGIRRLQSVYVNEDGKEDVGLLGFSPLAFSHERLTRYIDAPVTGELDEHSAAVFLLLFTVCGVLHGGARGDFFLDEMSIDWCISGYRRNGMFSGRKALLSWVTQYFSD
jgi:hypothetical protein